MSRASLEKEIVELIPALRSFARRFYSQNTDAEDLVQETLLKAISNLDKFEEGTKLLSWMFTVMRNTFCTRYKNARREGPASVEAIFDTVSTAPSQEWSVAVRELDGAMAHLSTDQQHVLMQVVVLGDSYETAASEAGCAVGTIKSRINRARSRLIANLEGQERSLGRSP
jgi:RNA polymerase sigma-70 factor (ECF subfamily)